MNLLSKLFFTFPEEKHKEQVQFYKPQQIKTRFDSTKEFLYESYISIDAIAFYSGAYRVTMTELQNIAKHVIKAKELIVKDPSVIPHFFDINGSSVDSLKSKEKSVKNELKTLVDFRNKLIQKDTSMIFRNLIIKKQMDLGKRINELNITEEIQKEDLNKEYGAMLMRIKKFLINGGNLVKKLELEKSNFYKKYENVSKEEKYKLMVSLSLGGFIVRLPAMQNNIRKIQIAKKREAVNKWVSEFMKIVEDLHSHTRNKELIDQKIFIHEFLENCLYRKDHKFDKIFEMRSEILDLSLNSFEEYMQENVKQEEEIKKMIFTLSNIKDGKLDIIFNKDIITKYINFLLSNNEKDKENLLNEFKNKLNL
ncbi:hypothetical protein EHP00_1301 [Ecytonucleospora hepatopenaei]|uniref:Uncharacterized protein n=1 Tax=Ecytonucleospora hepatopenaei TaxID=646526 RepID=A0A1W0E6U2_9MICR|nr:hypothetical protein EHP00_1301 [Ecytonucleospora hepatopenaei]